MNTETTANAVEDIPFDGEDDEEAPIPTGTYPLALVAFKKADKPKWRQDQETKRNAENGTPEKVVDLLEWRWTFELFDCDYAGELIDDGTTRTWYKTSRAAKHAAALLGQEAVDLPEGGGSKMLAGKKAMGYIVAKRGRSYIKELSPYKPRKAKGQGIQPESAQDSIPAQKASLARRMTAAWTAQKNLGWSQPELNEQLVKVVKTTDWLKLDTAEVAKAVEHIEGLGKPPELTWEDAPEPAEAVTK